MFGQVLYNGSTSDSLARFASPDLDGARPMHASMLHTTRIAPSCKTLVFILSPFWGAVLAPLHLKPLLSFCTTMNEWAEKTRQDKTDINGEGRKK